MGVCTLCEFLFLRVITILTTTKHCGNNILTSFIADLMTVARLLLIQSHRPHGSTAEVLRVVDNTGGTDPSWSPVCSQILAR